MTAALPHNTYDEPAKSRVFLTPELPLAHRAAQFQSLRADHPGRFATNDAAAQFMRSIHLPASQRWAFLNNGKAGTSSARHLLFRLEFGVPMTVGWDVPADINSDAAIHHMQAAGVFRSAAALPDAIARLEGALRVTTVRHPESRALSAFEYLCYSNDLRHSWFAENRLRMNAMVGFDWTNHPRTADGFGRFLDYAKIMHDEVGFHAVDPHWRPQIDNIHPDIYKPDVIGRIEDMDGFFAELCARLNQPIPDAAAIPSSNRQTYRSDRAAMLTSANRKAIADLYAADFDWLGYDPGDPE